MREACQNNPFRRAEHYWKPAPCLIEGSGRHNYVAERVEAKAAAATIRRKWNVLMRILNLAVDFETLDKNRLKRVALPEAVNRERMAADEKLAAIQKVASEELWAICLVAYIPG